MNFDPDRLDTELAELIAAEGSTVDTTPVIDTTNHPGPDCPPWCVTGVDGACVSEFTEAPPQLAEAARATGSYVYARKRRQPDGTIALEAAIHQNDHGGRTTTLIIEQGSDMYESLLGGNRE